uniref:Uncharacterized protein n=1 Tax=Aegilops tauschii subsp. strangulata TaxID=200361 RepID=A0A453GKP1_AEGTS
MIPNHHATVANHLAAQVRVVPSLYVLMEALSEPSSSTVANHRAGTLMLRSVAPTGGDLAASEPRGSVL